MGWGYRIGYDSLSPFTTAFLNKNNSDITILSLVGRIITPNDVYTLTPRSCEYVTLCGQTDFLDVIKGVDFETRRLFWLFV